MRHPLPNAGARSLAVLAGFVFAPAPPDAPSMYPLGPPLNLKTANGDTVTVSASLDTRADVEAYDDGIQQNIAENDKNFRTVKLAIDALLAEGDGLGSGARAALDRKLRLIENARRIVHQSPNPS